MRGVGWFIAIGIVGCGCGGASEESSASGSRAVPPAAVVASTEAGGAESARAGCVEAFLVGDGTSATTWLEGRLDHRITSAESEARYHYFVTGATRVVRGPDEVHRADLRYTGERAEDLSEHESLLLGVASTDPHPAESVGMPGEVDGKVVAVVAIHWAGQAEAFLDAMDRGECPPRLSPRPSACRSCSPDDCESGCCQWVDMDCGLDSTCSGQMECDSSCCGGAP